MPLPLAHAGFVAAISSAVIFDTQARFELKRQQIELVVYCLVLSIVPDLDFIAGLAVCDIGRYHHGLSHSLFVCAFLGALAAFFIAGRLKAIHKLKIYSACIISIISHPLLDYFSYDSSVPFGVPLFWPFYTEYIISPVSLLSDVHREHDNLSNFLISILNWHNAHEVIIELFFACMIMFFIMAYRKNCRPHMLAYAFAATACGIFYWVALIRI